MTASAPSAWFILNKDIVGIDVAAGMLVLDYLRQRLWLTGTKEGCKEGDCGACCVIVGALQDDGSVNYRPMTSCLMPVGELPGKHLVTVEGLALEDGLSPVQQAMVDCGGTQCGYCTPGFIVGMTAGLMDSRLPLDIQGVRYAISGNLCRCTGYRSIKDAGVSVAQKLAAGLTGSANRVEALCRVGALPAYFRAIPSRLQAIHRRAESDQSKPVVSGRPLTIAGGTDLYVQRGEEIPDTQVALLNNGDPIRPARIETNTLVVDPRLNFEDFADDPHVQQLLPEIRSYNSLIASWPVRTRSSIGGNICNASPIADMTCLLLALDAIVELAGAAKSRRVPLCDFYKQYKVIDKRPDELLTEIIIPVPAAGSRINWEKVSKRTRLDIATVNSAAKIHVGDGHIHSASLALGGVAPIPLLLRKTNAWLQGRALTVETAVAAACMAQGECTPISDVRGSAEYKLLLARQLILAHFIKLFPEEISEEAIHAAL